RLNCAPGLDAAREARKTERLEAPDGKMQEGKLAESRLQRIIAHRQAGRYLPFALQPIERGLFIAERVYQLEWDRLAAGENAAVGDRRKLAVVHSAAILHQLFEPGIGIAHDRLDGGARLRAGRLEARGRGLERRRFDRFDLDPERFERLGEVG